MSRKSREGPELNRTKESTVMDDRKEFFLKELKEAEQVTITEPEVTLYDLWKRRFFDVLVRKEEDNKLRSSALLKAMAILWYSSAFAHSLVHAHVCVFCS